MSAILGEGGYDALLADYHAGDVGEVPEVTCQRHGHRPYEAECQLCAMEHHRAEGVLRRYLEEAGAPKRFQGARLADYRLDHEGHERALAAVQDVLAGRSLMALLGGRHGTGKTLLGVAAAHEWVDGMLAYGDGRGAAVYVTARALVDGIKESWTDQETSESQVVRRYTEAGLLILDEIGDGRGKPEEVYQLSHVINARYEHQRPTILITNYALAGLGQSRVLDDRALSRLRGSDVRRLECTWDDERAASGKDRAAEGGQS